MSIASQYVTGRKIIVRIHPYIFQEANILSVYNLCSSLPFELLTASVASAYTVSLLVVELVASLGDAVVSLCTILNPIEVASPASVYSLATAVT